MAKKFFGKSKAKASIPATVVEEPKEMSYVTVDYPQENEVISSPDYTMRIGASSNGCVDVSIDGGEWCPARCAGGYWWFDWSPCVGSHKITARLVNNGSVIKKSDARKCKRN